MNKYSSFSDRTVQISWAVACVCVLTTTSPCPSRACVCVYVKLCENKERQNYSQSVKRFSKNNCSELIPHIFGGTMSSNFFPTILMRSLKNIKMPSALTTTSTVNSTNSTWTANQATSNASTEMDGSLHHADFVWQEDDDLPVRWWVKTFS